MSAAERQNHYLMARSWQNNKLLQLHPGNQQSNPIGITVWPHLPSKTDEYINREGNLEHSESYVRKVTDDNVVSRSSFSPMLQGVNRNRYQSEQFLDENELDREMNDHHNKNAQMASSTRKQSLQEHPTTFVHKSMQSDCLPVESVEKGDQIDHLRVPINKNNEDNILDVPRREVDINQKIFSELQLIHDRVTSLEKHFIDQENELTQKILQLQLKEKEAALKTIENENLRLKTANEILNLKRDAGSITDQSTNVLYIGVGALLTLLLQLFLKAIF